MRYHKIIMLIRFLGLYNRSYVSLSRYKEISYKLKSYKMVCHTNQFYLLGVLCLVFMVSSGKNEILFLFLNLFLTYSLLTPNIFY